LVSRSCFGSPGPDRWSGGAERPGSNPAGGPGTRCPHKLRRRQHAGPEEEQRLKKKNMEQTSYPREGGGERKGIGACEQERGQVPPQTNKKKKPPAPEEREETLTGKETSVQPRPLSQCWTPPPGTNQKQHLTKEKKNQTQNREKNG